MFCKFIMAALFLHGCGPKASARRAALADPLSALNIQRYVQEVQPLVEQSVGRSFETPPTVELAQQAPFDDLLMAEQTLIYDKVMPDTPPAIRRQMIESSTRTIRRGLLGKYGLIDKRTYVCAEGLLEAMRSTGADPSHLKAWATLIVAHEITHALEDQETGLLGILDTLADEDSLMAASATWEGLATLAAEDVARELGLMDSYDELIALQGWSREGLEDTRAYETWAIYGQGRDFIAHHRNTAGIEKMWEVMQNPPPNTAMLFRPESWSPEVSPPALDHAEILRGTEQLLTKGEWVISNTTLGEITLRGEAVASGNEAELNRVLAHLEHAQALELMRPDRSGAIRLLMFDDATWPATYLALLRREETAASAQTAANRDVTVEVTYEPLPELRRALDADAATLRTERIPLANGRHRESRSAWVARRDALVVVRATDFRPGLRLGRTVEEVFSRLEEARDRMQPGVAPDKTP